MVAGSSVIPEAELAQQAQSGQLNQPSASPARFQATTTSAYEDLHLRARPGRTCRPGMVGRELPWWPWLGAPKDSHEEYSGHHLSLFASAKGPWHEDFPSQMRDWRTGANSLNGTASYTTSHWCVPLLLERQR